MDLEKTVMDHISSLTTVTLIETRKNQTKSTMAAFIDFRKAYDSVNRNKLFEKLRYNGIHGKMYNALKAIYDNVSCAMRINGKLTDWFNVGCGLKQGCSLSNILFNMYIDDLIKNINALDIGIDIGNEKVGILVYADDVVLLSENEQDLQTLLNELNTWCLNNEMSVNASKSKIMHFRPQSFNITQVNFFCGDQELEKVNQYVYLGLVLTEVLDYSVMAQHVANSAGRALGLVIAKFKSAGSLPFSTFTKLYDSMVWSIIDFGASVWGFMSFSCITAIQNRALRFYMGVGRYTPNAGVAGDTGWKSTYLKQLKNVFGRWCRIKSMDGQRINVKIYNWSIRHGDTGRSKNWAHHVKDILNDSNLLDYFHMSSDDHRFNSKYLIRTLLNFYSEIDMHSWLEAVSRIDARNGVGRNKLRTYKLFKLEYKTENYIRINLPRSLRSAYAKFRTGVAPLRLETDRYERLNLEQRVCFNCESEIESEEYVLTQCPLYNDLRRELYTRISRNLPGFEAKSNTEKLTCILGCDLIPVIRISAKICSDILIRRRQLLYS